MNFYTLFTPTANVHLIKDVGMYPESLGKYQKVDAHLVCYENGAYPYLGTHVKNLKLDFIEKKNGKIIDGMKYIKKHAREIDVLNVYHLNLSSYFYLKCFNYYKRKDAISYLKLDSDHREIKRVSAHNPIAWIKKKTVLMADIATVETTILRDELNKYLKGKLMYLPDGIEINAEPQVSAEEKEDIVLSVGRLGTRQKNTYQLIDNFLSEDRFAGYKLMLAGTATPEILEYIKAKNQDDRIEYLGEITDRNELNKLYRRAKIFYLPSLYESFGIVMAEALYFGDYVIASDTCFAATDLMSGLESYSPGSQQFIDGARKKIENEFSYEKISNNLMRYLQPK